VKKGTMKKSVSILLAFLLILSLQLAPVAVFAEEESDSYIEEVVSLVNMERANEGLSELAIMEDLCYAAQVRAEELAELLDHERPDGSEWSTVLDEYEIVHSSAGENFAYGYKSPSAVMDAWMNSSGHRDNILNENFNYIGIGYYQDGASSYWVQLFISTEEEYQEDSEDTPAASEEDEEAEESPADDSAMPEQTSEVSETNPFGESGNIKSIEIAQVMGKGLSIDDGKLYPMRSLVAGKNTAILIELKEAVTIDPSGETQYVTISKDGKEVARLKPLGSAKETSLLEFLPKSIKDVNNWEAGNYTITAVIGNDKSSIDVKFQERMIMRILAVPVIGNWGGEIKSTKGEWKTAGKFTQAVYPLKNGGLVWELAPELDLSGDEYDLTTDDGMYAVWEALANKQTRDNKYTLIVGFVRDRQGDGDTQGYTYGMPATIVTESDEDMLATVAHEIAHCYEIGDEYEGGSINMKINPAPYGMSGTDWYTEEEIVANKQFIKSDPENYGDGSIVLEEQHAYEPYGRGLLGTVVSYMGSGAAQSQYWTTSALWEQLFKSFAHNGKQVSAAGDEAEEEPEEEWINLIDVSGVINKDGSVTLNPSYQYEGLWEDVEEPTGKGYFAVLLDKDGKELQKVEFGVSFTTRSNPPRNVDKAPFFVTMECTPETKSLEIRHGTQTIYRGEVSENKPEVSFDPIPANEELTGKHVIKWQGKDKDNDKLYYELWYVPNEEDWICVAKDITEASYEVDFDTLPGGKEAVFYLYATDGINTTFIKSQPFSVAYKEPEILTEQSEPQKYKVTDEIYFEVDVYDPQDGYMYEPEGQIVWTDKKGEVVSEDNVLFFFPYELSIGEHTFTMTATNSGGKSASKEYKLVIENDESALPQGWSREEFKEAMMYGLVDPSLMYGYTNNASKADLAATAVNLYYQLAEEIEDIEFSEEPLYSDYDDENGYAELAVSYGFLTADGDKFEPQRLVTRSEVVDTFCKVLAKAGFTINQDSKFVKDYSDIGTLSGASRTNMAYANSTGIIVGFGDNTLAPFDFSTREQLVVIAKRFADAVSE
jgi:hypothetical protein